MEHVLFEAVQLWNPKRNFSSDDIRQFINPEEPATDGLLYFVEELEHSSLPKWLNTYKEWLQWQQPGFVPPAVPEGTPAEEQPCEPCVDGECIVKISSDALSAYIMVLPAIGHGVPVSPAKVAEALTSAGVCSGIDSEACVSCCLECFTAFTVARGRSPVHGTDGKVTELFSREASYTVRVDENDTVDYRDLGWLKTVKAGDVICDVLQATEGVPGETVTGKPIPAKDGVMPAVPAGQNVKYSLDQTKLIAQCEGRLVFANNVFSVETTLVIHGNVDGNVGNITMPGNVVIKGSVLSGFMVYAKGTINISGVVENAYISAQGDIQISTGVKSDGSAVIESAKNISCKFIENATVRAKGNITAEYIVNSNISALSDINITRGKGTLVGGTVRVGRKISVRTIGNSANRTITISMGMDPDVLQQLQQNQKELQNLENKLSATNKNITFLEEQTSLESQYKKLLQQLKFQRTIDTMHINKLQKTIAKLEESFNPEACEIEVDTFYPPATIHIGSSSYHSTKIWQHHRVVFRDKDISFVPF